MRKRLEKLKAQAPAEATKNSPLMAKVAMPLPKYFATRDLETSDLNVRAAKDDGKAIAADKAAALIGGLNGDGYWPTPLVATSNPYTGVTPPSRGDGDFSQTHVGDKTDTSPYPDKAPAVGISTGAFIQNMTVLIDYLDQAR
jgi:hypothetical protein